MNILINHTLETDKPFGGHFVYYPDYTVSINYTVLNDHIDIQHASIRAPGSAVDIGISDILHTELARHYRAELLEHAEHHTEQLREQAREELNT